MSEHCVVLVTCPDRETAAMIAGSLVEEKLAACANLVEGVTSVYRWKGEIQQEPEVLLIIKTRMARFEEIKTRVQALHPYEVPEIISADITAGNVPYLNWIDESTR